MSRDEINISDVFQILSVEKWLNFRALVFKTEETWKIHTAYLENSFQLHNTKGFLDYGEVGFILQRVSGNKIVDWLQSNLIKIKDTEYIIPPIQPNIHTNKFPSHTTGYWLESIYPFSTYELNFSERDVRLDEFNPLISNRFPSFPNLKAATFYYLFDKFHDKRYESGNPLSNNLRLQISQKDCWIDKVFLAPSSISINVKGNSVNNTKIEVWVGKQHFEDQLTKKGRKTFILNKGLADKIWIVVSKNNQWLDEREIDLKYRNYADKSDNLVVKFLDKQVEIKGIIARGEGETTEFKIQVPNANESSKLTKTVAAFANGEGGVIIVGVEDNTGKIVGIKGNVEQEKSRLTQMIRNNLTHQPIYKIYIQKVDGVELIVVQVESGTNRPYGIHGSNPNYYVRRGATTFPATPDEIRILSQTSQSDNSWDFYNYK